MKLCGACDCQLPDDAFSAEQQGLRQTVRRCTVCVATGNQLMLMKRGRTRDDDICSVCQSYLPIEEREYMMQPCCMQRVCNGCILSSYKCGINNCPFCRTAVPTDNNQIIAMVKKRVAASDPAAICFYGSLLAWGGCGLVKDVRKAITLCQQAAEQGVKEAHHILGNIYSGNYAGYAGNEEIGLDLARSNQHYEEAAMRGHVLSRFNLGVVAYNVGHRHLALQHFLISAKLGHKASLDVIQRLLKEGIAKKKDYAGALQECEAAVDDMSSPSRDEAKTLGRRKVLMYAYSR